MIVIEGRVLDLVPKPVRLWLGTAVLLVSEDLDEILELSDRVVVMFNGQLVYETTSSDADLGIIGRHMTGHST